MNSTLNAAMNTTMNMTLFFLVGDFEPEAKPIAGLVVSIVWLCLVVIIPAVLYVRDFRFMRTVDKKPLYGAVSRESTPASRTTSTIPLQPMQKEATKAPEAPKAGVTPAPAKVPAPVEEKAVDPPLLDAPAKTAGKKMPWDKDEESESSDGEMDMGGSADWMDAMTPQEAKLQSWEKEVKKGESEA